MNIETTQEAVSAEYFATISDGKIVTLGKAVPPHTLKDCQIALSKEEFDILTVINGKMDKFTEVIKAVRSKIKSNGS
jgi:hypothetical protein